MNLDKCTTRNSVTFFNNVDADDISRNPMEGGGQRRYRDTPFNSNSARSNIRTIDRYDNRLVQHRLLLIPPPPPPLNQDTTTMDDDSGAVIIGGGGQEEKYHRHGETAHAVVTGSRYRRYSYR